jgi:hypothetical protein
MLDSAGPGCACPFSQQPFRLSKINGLAVIRANPDGSGVAVSAVAAQHDFWG